MKILVCLDLQWPCDETFIEEVLARRLPQLGHEVRIIFTAGQGATADVRTWHGASVVIVKARSAPGKFLAKLRAVLRETRKGGWDWLFVRNDSLIAYIGTFLKPPVAFYLSHQKEETRLEMVRGRIGARAQVQRFLSLASRFFRRRAMKRARLALLISDHLLGLLRDTGERTGPSVVMPMGVAPSPWLGAEERQAVRREFGGSDGITMLLYLGTLHSLRRLDTLIEAVSKVRQTTKDVALWMVGEGPSPSDRKRLQDIVVARGATDYVFLPGRVSHKEATKLGGAVDFGLSYFPDLPLFKQNSPTKVMEYLGQGLPTICTPQPEHEYAISICDGGIVSTGYGADAIAEAILQALGKSWDRKRIREDFLAVRSYDALATQLEKALEDV